ncbi:SphA family protein [Vogesella indigofera]|uniref:SphA family protein n=1 Tax=Vogesella indigofera TaxID=45465 RepID=UPI00234C9589|nr:transporter [Vogesella indigofera]MDC7705542.1 transporter [Vogesella indigofera]
MQQSRALTTLVTMGALLSLAAASWATEGGGGMYPNGNENYLTGALPPPGFYVLGYASSYRADTLRDNNGDKLPVDFKLQVNAVAPRFIWVSDLPLAGGQLAMHAITPLVELDATVNGQSQRKRELGDIVLGGGAAYHVSDKLHYYAGLDINAPTGQFDKNDLVNVGRNYWNVEPLLAVSYVQPSGINADVKLMYDYNWKNKDTDYRSGQEVHADYALGWGFGNGWVAGVGGYAYRQVTDDTGPNVAAHGNRGKAFAIGPSIKYDNGKGYFVTAKWQRESGVANRARGSEFKLRMTLPF